MTATASAAGGGATDTPCDPAMTGGAFEVAEDGSWTFGGALTIDNATAVLEQTEALPLPKGGRVDMKGLAHADSSALAVLLALRRRAIAKRHKLHFANMPDSLTSLGRVYGIEDLIAG